MQRDLVIVNELGLHARCAAKIAQRAQHARGKVMLARNDETVDATSILDLLTLACPKGTRVTLSISDQADAPIMEQIASMIEGGFDE